MNTDTLPMPTLENLTLAIKSTFTYWIELHFNPEVWATDWDLDDVVYAFKTSPELSNNYFTFDWRTAAIREHVKGQNWVRCPDCGDYGPAKTLGCYCEVEPEPVSEDEILDWFDVFYPDNDGLADVISESDLLYVLETEGFQAYAAGVHPLTIPIKEDMEAALEALDTAETPSDLLAALAWALHIEHVNGNIMHDYGEEHDEQQLDYSVVDRLQQSGLSAFYTDADFEAYFDLLGVAA